MSGAARDPALHYTNTLVLLDPARDDSRALYRAMCVIDASIASDSECVALMLDALQDDEARWACGYLAALVAVHMTGEHGTAAARDLLNTHIRDLPGHAGDDDERNAT